jgi:hypothetical protein
LRAFDLRGFDFCFLILRAGMASAVVFDERLVAILMQHFLADERAGWGGWARLSQVNRACAIVFREHSSRLWNFCYGSMHLLIEAKNHELREKDRQLWHWMKNCTCRPFHRRHDSDDGEDSDDMGGETEPATTNLWY